jgi:hypothetical protein
LPAAASSAKYARPYTSSTITVAIDGGSARVAGFSSQPRPAAGARAFVCERRHGLDISIMQQMKVDKQKFDAALAKLLAAPPLPRATIERKRPKKAAPSKPSER